MAPITPKEAVELAHHYKGVNEAARQLKIPRSTFGDLYRKGMEPEGTRVLVIGDTHCPVMLENYVEFLQETYKKWKCKRVVHIGDAVDWSSISYHKKPATLSNPAAEFDLAKAQIARLRDAFPVADVMIGNHDALPERLAEDVRLPVGVLRDYADMWNTPKWTWHERYGTLDIDGVHYVHGDCGKQGMHAAFKNCKENFKSRVQGHLHSQGSVEYFANHNHRIFGMQVGCGIDHHTAAMAYGRKFTAKPIIGCGVVLNGIEAHFIPMQLERKYL